MTLIDKEILTGRCNGVQMLFINYIAIFTGPI